MIPRHIIDEIIFRNDIEQIIGGYVTLKRAGSNMNGLCPFHSEKTPSFTVFTKTKSFHCFGCGAGGDVISFIMRVENLSYVEALEFLAARAGITIPRDDEHKVDTVPRQRMYEMNLAAAKFFRECLFDEQKGADARKYLIEKRGLNTSTIRRFGIGCCPNNAWELTNHMHSLGFTDKELTTGFLCGIGKNSGKPYDYFRNRVIFPIIDTTGNSVAFGGRVLDDSKPKYLNTSDTPAFKKSRHLFALNFAKKHCEEQMLLCEGYMDVVSLHEAGFENAVATLGTAITPDQARIFAKYTKQVVICYDADGAGQTAASKAIRLLGEVGIDVRVLKLEGAKDPDEYIKKFGAEAFSRILNSGVTGFDFRLGSILSKFNLAASEDIIKASEAVCAMISDFNSEVERSLYIRKASEVLKISPDAMLKDVERIRRARMRDMKSKQSQEAQMSVKSLGDRVNVDAARNVRGSRSEEAILGLMLIYDEFRHDAAKGQVGLTDADFVTDFGRRVFSELCRLENSEEGYSKAMLWENFNLDEISRIDRIGLDRRELARNDREVFLASIDALKSETKQINTESDPFADLRLKREQNKRAQEKTKK